jgi:hypothetical protein
VYVNKDRNIKFASWDQFSVSNLHACTIPFLP